MSFPEAEFSAWVKAPENARVALTLASSAVAPLSREEALALGIVCEAPFRSGPDGAGPFREALAARYSVPEDRVVIASGTTGANFLVLAANLEGRPPHPLALVETPGFTPIDRTLEGLGYRVERVPRDGLASAPVEGAAVLVVTSPHNPTGHLLDRATLARLAERCASSGALLLVDEVYRALHEAESASAIPGVAVTDSLSKCFGLAELRAGWAIADAPLAARARRVADHVTGEVPAPTRQLAARALAIADALLARGGAIAERNRGTLEHFVAKHGLAWSNPPAGVHALLSVNDPDFAARAREDGLLVVPGAFFGESTRGAIRVGWGSLTFDEALAALGRTLSRART